MIKVWEKREISPLVNTTHAFIMTKTKAIQTVENAVSFELTESAANNWDEHWEQVLYCADEDTLTAIQQITGLSPDEIHANSLGFNWEVKVTCIPNK